MNQVIEIHYLIGFLLKRFSPKHIWSRRGYDTKRKVFIHQID